MSKKEPIELNFKVKPTSEGYLAQGIELPGIIIESKNQEDLNKDLETASHGYFKAFPKELDKFQLKESEAFTKINIQI